MARKQEYRQINIDVEPFLSIMAIVLKLISLILVVIVMRIALNPKMKKIMDLGLWSGSKGNIENAKEPKYIDCFPDKIVIYPGKIVVTKEDLKRPENAVTQLMDEVQANTTNEYVVLMARPQSVYFFRAVRKMLSTRPIDVGYDAVDADFKVDWDAARNALSVASDTDTNAPESAPVSKPATTKQPAAETP